MGSEAYYLFFINNVGNRDNAIPLEVKLSKFHKFSFPWFVMARNEIQKFYLRRKSALKLHETDVEILPSPFNQQIARVEKRFIIANSRKTEFYFFNRKKSYLTHVLPAQITVPLYVIDYLF